MNRLNIKTGRGSQWYDVTVKAALAQHRPKPLKFAQNCLLKIPRGFSAFSMVDGAIKALFGDDIYDTFKALEIPIGPGLGSSAGSTFAVYQFIEKRDAVIKSMYSLVLG